MSKLLMARPQLVIVRCGRVPCPAGRPRLQLLNTKQRLDLRHFYVGDGFEGYEGLDPVGGVGHRAHIGRTAYDPLSFRRKKPVGEYFGGIWMGGVPRRAEAIL